MGRAAIDFLEVILARKAREVARRRLHGGAMVRAVAQPMEASSAAEAALARRDRVVRALRRPPGASPRLIAEVKFRSPSAGRIRTWRPGEAVAVARAYERGGAHAVSVLADGPGFGGSVLNVRRVADSVRIPVLFKEFVIDPVQVAWAQRVGASLVLLLVRALDSARLGELVDVIHRMGMEPVVEAASSGELEVALGTGARVIGVNARDLTSFEVDTDRAEGILESIPTDRVAVFMSGVKRREHMRSLCEGRADVVLVGESLMAHPDPEGAVRELLLS